MERRRRRAGVEMSVEGRGSDGHRIKVKEGRSENEERVKTV